MTATADQIAANRAAIAAAEVAQEAADVAAAQAYLLGADPAALLPTVIRLATALLDCGGDIAPHMTCRETEAVADLFEAIGRPGDADLYRRWHAVEDDEGDRHDPDTGALIDDDDDDDDGCPGHESLAGEHMGEAVYCDGTYQP